MLNVGKFAVELTCSLHALPVSPSRCNYECIVYLFAVNLPDAPLSHGQSALQKIVVRLAWPVLQQWPRSLLGCNGVARTLEYPICNMRVELPPAQVKEFCVL